MADFFTSFREFGRRAISIFCEGKVVPQMAEILLFQTVLICGKAFKT